MLFIVSWFFDLWSLGAWYDRIYLSAALLLVLSLFLYVLFFPFYLQVKRELHREYDRLASSHFFLVFRGNKRAELSTQAFRIVQGNNKNFGFYTFAGFLSNFSLLAGTVAFCFFLGSMFYEQVLPNISDYGPSIANPGADGDYPDSGGNLHHVDPHWVDGYDRSDGTEVDGYWRGGDEGYDRSNPDGDLSNNLDYDGDAGESDSAGFFDGF